MSETSEVFVAKLTSDSEMFDCWRMHALFQNGKWQYIHPHAHKLPMEAASQFKWDRINILDFPQHKQVVYLAARKEMLDDYGGGMHEMLRLQDIGQKLHEKEFTDAAKEYRDRRDDRESRDNRSGDSADGTAAHQ